MTWAAAAFLVVAFLVLLAVLRVPARAGQIAVTGRDALRTLRDDTLSDAQKEQAMRAGSLRLFVLFLQVAAATAVALAVPAGIVALLAQTGAFDVETVLDRTLSWQILAGATVLGVLAMRWLGRRSS